MGRIIHCVDHAKVLHDVIGKIRMLKNRISEIHSNKINYHIEDNESTIAGEDTLRRELIKRLRSDIEEDDVVGLSNDSRAVIQRLNLEDSQSHSPLSP